MNVKGVPTMRMVVGLVYSIPGHINRLGVLVRYKPAEISTIEGSGLGPKLRLRSACQRIDWHPAWVQYFPQVLIMPYKLLSMEGQQEALYLPSPADITENTRTFTTRHGALGGCNIWPASILYRDTNMSSNF